MKLAMFHWCTLKSRKNYLFVRFPFDLRCLFCGLREEGKKPQSPSEITQLLSFFIAIEKTNDSRELEWMNEIRKRYMMPIAWTFHSLTNGPFRVSWFESSFFFAAFGPQSSRVEHMRNRKYINLFFLRFIHKKLRRECDARVIYERWLVLTEWDSTKTRKNRFTCGHGNLISLRTRTLLSSVDPALVIHQTIVIARCHRDPESERDTKKLNLWMSLWEVQCEPTTIFEMVNLFQNELKVCSVPLSPLNRLEIVLTFFHCHIGDSSAKNTKTKAGKKVRLGWRSASINQEENTILNEDKFKRKTCLLKPGERQRRER